VIPGEEGGDLRVELLRGEAVDDGVAQVGAASRSSRRPVSGYAAVRALVAWPRRSTAITR
jgi:hypothetical protein